MLHTNTFTVASDEQKHPLKICSEQMMRLPLTGGFAAYPYRHNGLVERTGHGGVQRQPQPLPVHVRDWTERVRPRIGAFIPFWSWVWDKKKKKKNLYIKLCMWEWQKMLLAVLSMCISERRFHAQHFVHNIHSVAFKRWSISCISFKYHFRSPAVFCVTKHGRVIEIIITTILELHNTV